MLMLPVLLFGMAVHGSQAPPPNVDGNHYVGEGKALEAKMTKEGELIKSYERQLDTATKRLEQHKSQLENASHMTDPSFRKIVQQGLNTKITNDQIDISNLQKSLDGERQLQVKDIQRYRDIQPKMSLYHVNNYDDFHKADWIQPWFVRGGTEVSRWAHLWSNATSTVTSPIPSEEQGGFQEKARLMRTTDPDVYVAQSSNNYIQKIVVSEKMTLLVNGDQYIDVTFKDMGQIRYKQPKDRMRADHDMWVRTYDWHVGGLDWSPHHPAENTPVSHYPDALLLMRPKAKGDSDKSDVDLIHQNGWETAARTAGVIGGVVGGIVGVGALLFTWPGQIILCVIGLM